MSTTSTGHFFSSAAISLGGWGVVIAIDSADYPALDGTAEQIKLASRRLEHTVRELLEPQLADPP